MPEKISEYKLVICEGCPNMLHPVLMYNNERKPLSAVEQITILQQAIAELYRTEKSLQPTAITQPSYVYLPAE